jgi:regulator of protease activity HflC (stomatin/prohibitin superfamily)
MTSNDAYERDYTPLFVIGGIMAVVAVILFYCCCWVTVPKGHVGVTSVFGKVQPETLPSGLHIVSPWTSIHRMSCMTQKDEEDANTTTANGLSVGMKATMLYHLRPEHAAQVAVEIGHADYQPTIVTPRFKNAVRDVTAEFQPEAFYSAERQKIEARVLDRVRQELPHFEVEAIMLLDPVMPKVVQDRIQAKVGAEQDAIRMQSVYLQRELEGKANKRVKELEAEAKVIEAKGIADSQKIIKTDLDDNYLRYLWIEALKESARHNNATIYVPTGFDGMPFMKGVHPGKDR